MPVHVHICMCVCVCTFSVYFELKVLPFTFYSQCNNPMTKEPKLQAAVRIVPEWTSYDEEIKQLMQGVQEDPPVDIVRPEHSKGHTEL